MNPTEDGQPGAAKDDFYRDYVNSEDNEILVDIADEERVRRTLLGLGIHEDTARSRTSPNLRLTLFAFEEPSGESRRVLNLIQGAQTDDDDLVGLVLNAVKKILALSEPERPLPTIGRNRLVGHVDGTNGNVIVRDDNEPEPVSPRDFRPRPSTLESSTQGGGAPPAIRVAIIDTALRPHEFLEGKAVTPAAPEAFVPGGKYSYRAGHGTFVTGLVLGQAPDAAVTVIGTLDKEGRASSWDVANAILDSAAGADGAQIINLSLACYTSDGIEPLVFSRAISELPKDTLVVAAAGNMGNRHPPAERKLPDLSKAPAWPAALPNVLAIGAATGPNNRQRAPFSPNVPWINVLAPGVDVVSILPEGGKPLVPPSEFAKWSGTSFSAAEFTGAVAERAAAQNLSPLDAYFTLRDEGANGFTFLNDEF